jgi:hypothetical protein
MHYVTVFDAANQPFRDWLPIAMGLAFMTISGLTILKPNLFKNLNFSKQPFFYYVMFGFSALWTVCAATGLLGDYFKIREVARSNQCNTVEGIVENFHPMPYEGHDSEHFNVGKVAFSYSDYVLSPGFHQSESHGGPIHSGSEVRICYFNGEILKLAIKR